MSWMVIDVRHGTSSDCSSFKTLSSLLCSLVGCLWYGLGSLVMKHVPNFPLMKLRLCPVQYALAKHNIFWFLKKACVIYFGDFVFCLYSSFDFHVSELLVPLDSKHHFSQRAIWMTHLSDALTSIPSIILIGHTLIFLLATKLIFTFHDYFCPWWFSVYFTRL